jgi:phosphoenolpyruvate carboxykinase (ATP)
MKLGYTRAMVRAALDGELTDVRTTTDPVFGLAVPQAVRNVPPELMNPRSTWSDPAAYDAQAKKLAQMFAKNFEQFAAQVSDEVRQAGPKG